MVIDKMQIDESVLPILHINEPSEPHCRVEIDKRAVYFTNVKCSYKYDERIMLIRGWRNYFPDLNSIESRAYQELMWHLFPDYLDAFSFFSISLLSITTGHDKDLYIVRNSLGFIKVGIASDVSRRISVLRSELGGEFEIVKIIKDGGKYESLFHSELMIYLALIKNRSSGKVSTECFLDVPEVHQKIEYLLENLNAVYSDFIERFYN